VLGISQKQPELLYQAYEEICLFLPVFLALSENAYLATNTWTFFPAYFPDDWVILVAELGKELVGLGLRLKVTLH